MTSFDDATVTTNAAYWCRIVSFNECAVSGWSSARAQLRIAPPAQPPYHDISTFADKIQLLGYAPVPGATLQIGNALSVVAGNHGPWMELLTTNISRPDLMFRYDDTGLAVVTRSGIGCAGPMDWETPLQRTCW